MKNKQTSKLTQGQKSDHIIWYSWAVPSHSVNPVIELGVKCVRFRHTAPRIRQMSSHLNFRLKRSSGDRLELAANQGRDRERARVQYSQIKRNSIIKSIINNMTTQYQNRIKIVDTILIPLNTNNTEWCGFCGRCEGSYFHDYYCQHFYNIFFVICVKLLLHWGETLSLAGCWTSTELRCTLSEHFQARVTES